MSDEQSLDQQLESYPLAERHQADPKQPRGPSPLLLERLQDLNHFQNPPLLTGRAAGLSNAHMAAYKEALAPVGILETELVAEISKMK